MLGASQVEYKPFGKPPLKREVLCLCLRFRAAQFAAVAAVAAQFAQFASELHAELHTGSNQKMVGACFQPRLTRQPAESYGSTCRMNMFLAVRVRRPAVPAPRSGFFPGKKIETVV